MSKDWSTFDGFMRPTQQRSWEGIIAWTAAIEAQLGAERSAVAQWRTSSDQLLHDLDGDPSARDWTSFLALRRDREEDWSNWLPQLIEDSTTGRFAWALLNAIEHRRIDSYSCIVGPLLSLLPQVSDTVRGALVFRFLRVGRAVAFSARAGALAVQKRQESRPKLRHGETRITIVRPEERLPTTSSWPELLAWAGEPTPAWYHASNVGGDQLKELARAAGLSDQDVGDFIDSAGQPRLRISGGLRAWRSGCRPLPKPDSHRFSEIALSRWFRRLGY